MMKAFRNLLAPPIFKDDDEKTRIARILYGALFATYILLPTALVVLIVNPDVGRFYGPVVIALAVIATILLVTTRAGYVRAASMVLIASFLVMSTFVDISANGEMRPISILSGAVVVAGGLLLGRRGAFITAILYGIKHFAVLFLLQGGVIVISNPSPGPTLVVDVITTTVSYLMIAFIFNLASSNIYAALMRVRQSEVELTNTNRQLQELTQNLEKRIQERTADLENATALSQRRARQFETITRVSRTITSAQDLQELLPRIVEAISEEFGFYHVSIFLNDDDDQNAVLKASNSPGGKAMLKRGHRLKIGEQGIVGYTTGTGNPRIALDVGTDAVYFDNPDLPATRSEMALPLKIGKKVVGALDVQSTEPSAFTNEDIASLSVLADQVSIAIENARLYETTRASLEQTEAAYRQYVLNEWTRFMREEKLAGFRYADKNSMRLDVPLDLGEIARAAYDGNIHQTEMGPDGKPAQLAIPVKLRGEVIGLLHISTAQKYGWTDDEIDIAEAVADRVAISIENARMFQTSNSWAARERIVSDISSKISGNIRVENILRLAAQELSQALDGSDVLIQLQPPEKAGEVQHEA